MRGRHLVPAPSGGDSVEAPAVGFDDLPRGCVVVGADNGRLVDTVGLRDGQRQREQGGRVAFAATRWPYVELQMTVIAAGVAAEEHTPGYTSPSAASSTSHHSQHFSGSMPMRMQVPSRRPRV